MQDSLGDRMKRYERISSHSLIPKTPLIIRVDGKAFHTWTKGFNKPFDIDLIACMAATTRQVAKEMQSCRLTYTQSDEATFLLSDYETNEKEGWFAYKLNKVVSVTASMYTAYFNEMFPLSSKFKTSKPALFDARAFSIPLSDAPNCFIWRQQDWLRNSVSMYAQANFSHKELQGVNVPGMLNMLHDIGKPWEHLDPIVKYGTFSSNGKDFWDKLDYNMIVEILEESQKL